MEGIWFYWLAWMGWVVLTFLWKKGKFRTVMAASVLMIIITAHQYVDVMHTKASMGFIFLFAMNFVLISSFSYKKHLYFFICTVILTFSYVSFHLFKIYDPVWVFFHPSFMVALILTYLTLLLFKNKRERYMIFLFGLCHGELLNGFIMNHFSFPVIFGALSFFDICAIGLTCISFWNGFEWLSATLNQMTKKTNKRKAGI